MSRRSNLFGLLMLLLSDLCDGSEWEDLSEAEQRNINDQLSSFLSNNDIKSLPIHKRESRTSSCSEDPVQEIVHYRFTYKDLAGQERELLYPVATHNIKAEISKMTIDGDTLVEVATYPALNCFNYNEEPLLHHIQEKIFSFPDGQPLNLSHPFKPEGESGLPLIVDKLVFGEQLKNGFFIEAGSQDAEENSNSLHFEVTHGWTGLLVEGHPMWHHMARWRHRNATLVNTCLGIEKKPAMADFDWAEATDIIPSMAGLVPEPGERSIRLQCLPLASLVLAMGNPTVHYFSLDIEGAELQVV